MTEYVRERQLKKKRDYYRKWRAEHPESVRAANIRYWTKKALEMQQAAQTGVETRNTEED